MNKAEMKKNEEVKAMAVVGTQYVDTADVTAENRLVGEILMITQQTKQLVLMASIEIGRRLVEAKKLVKHGQWTAWLKERIDYSQRTANNFMKIYEQYGESGLAEKSQSIANLSYTQALTLLELPAEQRERFVEENNAKDMKIKELQDAIKRLNAEKDTERKANEQRYQMLIRQKDLR